MRELIKNFPQQLKEAFEIGKNASLKEYSGKIDHVLICGQGGSGIGGSLITQIVRSEAKIPVVVNSDYDIPNWVNENTLVIISSYSGNTEETLSALSSCKQRNCEFAIITSGGKALEFAENESISHIVIPGGLPPRSCLGYSLSQLFFVFKHYNIISSELLNELESCSEFLKSHSNNLENKATNISSDLLNKITVIYSSGNYEPVSVRFQQQIDENSKQLAWCNVVPEMNHNEIVGWTEKNENLSVITIHDQDDFDRVKHRLEYVKKVVEPLVSSYNVVIPQGENLLQKYFYLIHLFDWVSVQIAELKNIDPVEVDVITRLKDELATVK